MGFTLLGKEFDNIGDVSFGDGKEVDKLIYNGSVIWEHYPKWLALTEDGYLYYGSRAIDMSGDNYQRPNGNYAFDGISLCKHKGVILCGSNYGNIYYTTSWSNPVWETATLADSNGIGTGTVELMCSNGDICIAVVSATDETALYIYRSTDGITWKKVSEISGNSYIYELRYIDGKFYLCANNYLYSSTNGASWTDEEIGSAFGIQSVYYDGNLWLATDGYGMHSGYALDQLTQVATQTQNGEGFGKITSYNGMYFSGNLYYSDDGLNWVRNNISSRGSLYIKSQCVVYDGIQYYAFDQRHQLSRSQAYAVSDDGMTWTTTNVGGGSLYVPGGYPFADVLLTY